MKRGEIKKAVYQYLDSLKKPQMIGGWLLQDIIAYTLGYHVYPTVVLKLAREWAYLSGGGFDCVDRDRSLYAFTPGKKISGTHFETLPVGSHVKTYKAIRGIKAKLDDDRERGYNSKR
jgi:hypothetical protein